MYEVDPAGGQACSLPFLSYAVEVIAPEPLSLRGGRVWALLLQPPSSHWTGRGGASIYGKQFEDELHPDLKFTGECIGREGDQVCKACSLGCESG